MPERVARPARVRARRARNYKSVMRPTRWGNPFVLQPGGPYTRAESLERYERWLQERLDADPSFLEPLRGFHLGCACPPQLACHADVILRHLYGPQEGPQRRR